MPWLVWCISCFYIFSADGSNVYVGLMSRKDRNFKFKQEKQWNGLWWIAWWWIERAKRNSCEVKTVGGLIFSGHSCLDDLDGKIAGSPIADQCLRETKHSNGSSIAMPNLPKTMVGLGKWFAKLFSCRNLLLKRKTAGEPCPTNTGNLHETKCLQRIVLRQIQWHVWSGHGGCNCAQWKMGNPTYSRSNTCKEIALGSQWQLGAGGFEKFGIDMGQCTRPECDLWNGRLGNVERTPPQCATKRPVWRGARAAKKQRGWQCMRSAPFHFEKPNLQQILPMKIRKCSMLLLKLPR